MFSQEGYTTITVVLLWGTGLLMLFLAGLEVVEVGQLNRSGHGARETNCELLYDAIESDTHADLFDRACPEYFVGGDL